MAGYVSRRRQVLRKVISVSAMFGAAALVVATSLPAVALTANRADALTAETSSSSSFGAQSLTVAGSAVKLPTTRDSYTVVSVAQQSRQAYSGQNFSYSNDVLGSIQWPFPAQVPISSGFGPRTSPCSGCTSFHEGVDFTPGSGTTIGAIAAGTVTFVGYDSSYGYHVIVDHNINGQKVQSLYAHMLSRTFTVSVGQQVAVTQQLGEVGNSGHSTGTHLHLEIHLDSIPVDPFAWLMANAN